MFSHAELENKTNFFALSVIDFGNSFDLNILLKIFFLLPNGMFIIEQNHVKQIPQDWL